MRDLGTYDEAIYPANLNDLVAILSSAYSNTRTEALYGFQMMPKIYAGLEHTSLLTYTGQDYWNAIQFNDINASNTSVAQIWSGLYIGVKDANVALERADFYQQKYMGAGELSKVNAIRGEAYFLRAWYYMQLECFFGESYISQSGGGDKLGVPIYTKVVRDLSEVNQPRSTVRQVWDLIISDLKKSDSLLTLANNSSNGTGTDLGRVTNWAAKGLLGKAYVFTEDWVNAKAILADLITHSGKSLMPFNIYKQAFNSPVYPGALNSYTDQEYNSESLFELNIDRVAANYGIFGGLNLTTSKGLLMAPTGFQNNGLGSVSIGYGNQCVNDRVLLRFGFTIPVDSTKAATLVT
ncbi:MAG: RagB/SusD family nutrient uptake outer membrane protein, partial [Sphingobacteriales bacterium]|nr:RagB/SusD family nutrient uptake outer membrane protein [Sphingobacteriales bacterium]